MNRLCTKFHFALHKLRISSNLFTDVYKISKFNFCYKYIPSKALQFEEKTFHESVCKIYENKIQKSPSNTGYIKNSMKNSTYYKLISLGMYTTLLFNPYALILAQFAHGGILLNLNLTLAYILQNLNWVTNIFGQPIIFLKLKRDEKNSSIGVQNFYILKNGHQVLIVTQDNSVHLVNIKDIVKFEESDEYDRINLKTYDKEFVIDIKNSKTFNEDIFNAIKMRRIVNTYSSYSNYNRLTVQKLEDQFKARLNKPKKLSFNLDSLSVKKYLYSFNNFLCIKHLLNGNGFTKFYYNKNSKIELKNKEPKQMRDIKRKLNIHMYSDQRFFRKYGIEILQFLGQVASFEENTEEYRKLLTKLKETNTLGRNVKENKKKILI